MNKKAISSTMLWIIFLFIIGAVIALFLFGLLDKLFGLTSGEEVLDQNSKNNLLRLSTTISNLKENQGEPYYSYYIPEDYYLLALNKEKSKIVKPESCGKEACLCLCNNNNEKACLGEREDACFVTSDVVEFVLKDFEYLKGKQIVNLYLNKINKVVFISLKEDFEDELSILGPPGISAEVIEKVLVGADSPAVGTGEIFYDESINTGIKAEYILALFKKESNYGTDQKWIGYSTKGDTLSVGNIRPGSDWQGRVYCALDQEDNCFRKYGSWEESIKDTYELIKGPSYVGNGLTTVEKIAPKYCPPEECNVNQYIDDMRNFMDSYLQS